MSGMFQSFEQDFLEIISQISKTLNEKDLDEEELKESLEDINQAEKCLKQMEIEVSMQPLAKKAQMTQKLNDHRESFNTQLLNIKNYKQKFIDEKNWEALMGPEVFADENKQLINGDLLESAYTVEAMKSIKAQEEKLSRAENSAQQIEVSVERSTKLIENITRRENCNKAIMITGLLVLLVSAIYVYYKKLSTN